MAHARRVTQQQQQRVHADDTLPPGVAQQRAHLHAVGRAAEAQRAQPRPRRRLLRLIPERHQRRCRHAVAGKAVLAHGGARARAAAQQPAARAWPLAAALH
jgi:hypothetical protein